jgi:ArsR family transcriptional regulator, arsenate/arsenite/antimonite-responsive transcriptional repressor
LISVSSNISAPFATRYSSTLVELLESRYYFDDYRTVKERYMPIGHKAGGVTSGHPAVADEQVDLIFKALAAKPRREILTLLATGAGEGDARCCSPDEVCACVFVEKLGIGASTVSHHMKALIDAGLVAAEKRGSWVHYRLRPDAIQLVAGDLMALVGCRTDECR